MSQSSVQNLFDNIIEAQFDIIRNYCADAGENWDYVADALGKLSFLCYNKYCINNKEEIDNMLSSLDSQIENTTCKYYPRVKANTQLLCQLRDEIIAWRESEKNASYNNDAEDNE